MQPKTFRPRYSLLTWSLLCLYAAPFVLGASNAFAGWTGRDWKLFLLLSGAAWLGAGLLHLRGALLKRIRFSDTITVEMWLQRPARQAATLGVRAFGSLVRFEGRDVYLQYLANAGELMHLFVMYAGRGELNLVYDREQEKAPGWTAGRSLVCLAAFVLYMALALCLGFRPFRLIGPATDALLPVLVAFGAVLVGVSLFKKARGKKMEAPDTGRNAVSAK